MNYFRNIILIILLIFTLESAIIIGSVSFFEYISLNIENVPIVHVQEMARSNLIIDIIIVVLTIIIIFIFSFIIIPKIRRSKEKKDLARDEALLESMGEGLIAVDNDTRITVINKAAIDMLDLGKEEIIGTILTKLPLEDESGNPIPLNKRPTNVALNTGKSVSVTCLFPRRDKKKLQIAIISTPIIIGNRIDGAMIVFHDVTKEKEIDKIKTEFISIASHQLRTPVSGLNWLIEELQFTSENFTSKQKTYLRDLSTLSRRLITLVEDLLNISRIQLKTAIMAEKNLSDISGLIEEFIRETESYAKLKRHTITFNKNITGIINVKVNKKSFYSILQNLTSNAINYSPEDTSVLINLEKIGNFIKISISNKGPMIPKEEQAHLFERFYRGESVKKISTEGTGLGLYIVKIIVEEMGGKVGFESETGKDTVFWFELPLKEIT